MRLNPILFSMQPGLSSLVKPTTCFDDQGAMHAGRKTRGPGPGPWALGRRGNKLQVTSWNKYIDFSKTRNMSYETKYK